MVGGSVVIPRTIDALIGDSLRGENSSMGWIRGQAGMGSFDCGSRFASESVSYAQDDKGRGGIAGEVGRLVAAGG